MLKLLNCLFIGVILTASFFLFGGKETSFRKTPSFHTEPSMIPGAQAVRPLAANQSIRMEELLSDLGAAVVFPRPFCSLTENTYNHYPIVVEYSDPIIQRII